MLPATVLDQANVWLPVVLDTALHGVVLLDPGRRILGFNRMAADSARRVFLRELVPGDSFDDMVPAVDLKNYLDAMAKVAAGETVRIEHHALGPTGVEDWFVYQVVPLPPDPATGAPAGICFNAISQREQDRALQNLARGEERFRTFIEMSAEGIYCLEPTAPVDTRCPPDELVRIFMEHARLTECNHALARMYGFSRAEQLMGKRLSDLFVPTDRTITAVVERFLREGFRVTDAETHEVCRDGQTKVFLNNLVGVLEDGKLLRVWGTQRDITSWKRAETELRASEAKYRDLMDNLEQGVFLKDRALRLVAVNEQHCRNLGRTEAELLGKTDADLFPPHQAEKFRADDELALFQGRRLELEEEMTLRGRPRRVRIIKSPVHDDLGRITGVLGVYWDVTDQRALEAQVRHAQKMDAIGQLANGVAHDLNNMLTVVLGNLDLAMRKLPPNEAVRAPLGTAETAALRARDLVERLRQFSRRNTSRKEPIHLRDCIHDTVDILRRTFDVSIAISTVVPDDLALVQADREQLDQVLMNLCLNARDAMAQGGHLRIEAANVVVTPENLRRQVRARPGNFVRVQVIDTGVGIAPEFMPLLFEPFFTTKGPEQGPGLGLATAFSILDQHRGWIECESTPGQGTTVSCFLPAYQPPTPLPAVNPTVPSAEPQPVETVLFAEDEDLLRELGGTVLERFGYQVLTARDGLEALEIYVREKDRISVVVLDLTMPRLSGKEAFRRLRALDPEARVIFTSGYVDELKAVADLEGIQSCIKKPYRPEDLVRAVRAALEAKRSSS